MIYTSPAGPIDNLYNDNVVKFIRGSKYLNEHPDHKLYIDAETGEAIKAAEVLELAGKCHYILSSEYGVKYDDVVCTFVPNHIYVPVMYLGIASLGAITSPANWQYTPEELAHQLKLAKPSFIITTAQLRGTVSKAIQLVGGNIKVIVQHQLVRQIRSVKAVSKDPVPVDGKTKHLMYCFSSGTSGPPKGVISTHQNMTANIQQDEQSTALVNEWSEDMAFPGFLPMSHMYGMSIYTYRILRNATTLVVFEKFDFEKLLQAIVKYRITHIAAVPPILVLFAKSPLVDKYPEVRKIVKFLVSGAAPLPQSLSDAVMKRIRPPAPVLQTYGLTETTLIVLSPSADPLKYKSGSVGWPIAGTEIRLVDPVTGKDAPTGEIWVRSPSVMKGYVNDKKATEESLLPDGWYKTGDVATRDEPTGQFYIVDRVKELIKSKGYQVSPSELEAVLLTHPNVADCAVIGIYSEEEASELPRAFIVRKSRTGHSPLQIKQWLDGKVTKTKRLYGGIVEIEAIPKTPSGKMLRRVLQKQSGYKVHGMKKQSKL